MNDITPKFLHTKYKISIPINTKKNRPLIQIQTKNSNLKKTDKITYNIYNTSLIISTTLFTIDPTSKIVNVKTNLNKKNKIILFFFKYFLNFSKNTPSINTNLNYFSYYFYFSINNIYQFFIKTINHKNPQLKNNTPIKIYISNNNQPTPLTKPKHTFIITKNKKIKNIINKIIKITKNLINFNIISKFTKNKNNPKTISINQKKKIFLLNL